MDYYSKPSSLDGSRENDQMPEGVFIRLPLDSGRLNEAEISNQVVQLQFSLPALFKNGIRFLSIMALLVSCGEDKKETQPAVIQKVAVRTINALPQPEILSYSGTIEADNTVSLGFSVPGRITAVAIEEGQHVAQGQLLAAIETDEYQDAYTIANAGAEQAADNYKRLDLLYSKGSLPERDHISAKIALAQARANSSMALKRLKDTKIYAPFTGIITAKFIERGASAAPGVPALTIMKTDQVYARAAVNGNEIATVKIGIPAKVRITSFDEDFEGKVTIINPSADAATRTFDVKVLLDNPKGLLLPGMISAIRMETGRTARSITIPASAVVRDADDINYVFTALGKQAVRKRISLGNFTGDEVIVTKGLENGDRIIISGQRNLKDGQEISF